MHDSPETIGQRLKRLRLERNLTLEDVFQATRIRIPYLEALENDDYTAMSSAAQARGFLRLYADFLDLDLEAALRDIAPATATPSPETESPAQAKEASPARSASAPGPAAGLAEPRADRPLFRTHRLRRSASPVRPSVDLPPAATPAEQPPEQRPPASPIPESLPGEARPADDRQPAEERPARERIADSARADREPPSFWGRVVALWDKKKVWPLRLPAPGSRSRPRFRWPRPALRGAQGGRQPVEG